MTKEQLMTIIQACRAMEKFDEAFYFFNSLNSPVLFTVQSRHMPIMQPELPFQPIST